MESELNKSSPKEIHRKSEKKNKIKQFIRIY